MNSKPKTIEQTFMELQTSMNGLLMQLQEKQNLIDVQFETIRIMRDKIALLEEIAKIYKELNSE